mgnify:FL=1
MSTKRAATDAPTSASPSAGKKAREDAKAATVAAVLKTFSDPCTGALGERAYLNYTHMWLFADDMDATLEFYTKTLGFATLFRHENKWMELLG